MLLPWDQECTEGLTPKERMKVKLQKVAANRSARQNSGGEGEASGGTSGAAARYSFKADEADHCETPAEAYEDIAPILRLLAKKLGKRADEIRIYDPYYCNGSVKEHLKTRGFPSVYNRNEDFYQMWAENKCPPFDVIVTNPPYSANHVDAMIEFCVSASDAGKTQESGKPWFALLPNFCYTKSAYKHLLSRIKAHELYGGTEPFYVTPAHRYEYWSPDGTREERRAGRVTSPFISFWFVHLCEHTHDILQASCAALRKARDTAAPSIVPHLHDLPKSFQFNWKAARGLEAASPGASTGARAARCGEPARKPRQGSGSGSGGPSDSAACQGAQGYSQKKRTHKGHTGSSARAAGHVDGARDRAEHAPAPKLAEHSPAKKRRGSKSVER